MDTTFRERPPERGAGRHASGVERRLRPRRLRPSLGPRPRPGTRADTDGARLGAFGRDRHPRAAGRRRALPAAARAGTVGRPADTASVPETVRLTTNTWLAQ